MHNPNDSFKHSTLVVLAANLYKNFLKTRENDTFAPNGTEILR
jgi:hypothetical protein